VDTRSAPAPSWIRPLIDGSLTAAALPAPVWTGGAVADFAFEYVNRTALDPAARRGVRLLDATLLTAAPTVPADVLLPLLRSVLADGWSPGARGLPARCCTRTCWLPGTGGCGSPRRG
jgi:hypothetical protein